MHETFAEKFKLPYLLLSDPQSEIMKNYGAFGKKRCTAKKCRGLSVDSCRWVGGNLIKHWPTVRNCEAHPEEVLQFLKSL